MFGNLIYFIYREIGFIFSIHLLFKKINVYYLYVVIFLYDFKTVLMDRNSQITIKAEDALTHLSLLSCEPE